MKLTPEKWCFIIPPLLMVYKIGQFSIKNCHAFTFAMTPNSPDGLNIKTRINNKKAYMSL